MHAAQRPELLDVSAVGDCAPHAGHDGGKRVIVGNALALCSPPALTTWAQHAASQQIADQPLRALVVHVSGAKSIRCCAGPLSAR
eukprot:4763445-Amphidinium_carterae.1